LGEAVTSLNGNRDPLLEPGLDALRAGTRDTVIDTSGYKGDARASRIRDLRVNVAGPADVGPSRESLLPFASGARLDRRFSNAAFLGVA